MMMFTAMMALVFGVILDSIKAASMLKEASQSTTTGTRQRRSVQSAATTSAQGEMGVRRGEVSPMTHHRRFPNRIPKQALRADQCEVHA